MPQIKAPQSRGDLYVRAKIKIPRSLTAEQRDLYQKLAQSR
jgi:curved DNA-binding protein